MRNARVPGSRGHSVERPYDGGRLVGAGHLDLRVPDGLPALLELEPDRDLQTVRMILFRNFSPKPHFPALWQLITYLCNFRIVSKPVHFPNEPAISPEAKDIIRQFCTVDRSHRLGNISGGAAKVKSHPFFQGVVWDDVYYRKSKGPIIPPVRYPGDAQCFDMYPDERHSREPYTDELMHKWEDHFKDF